MAEQDVADSLRIARRELQLAVERHDEETVEMLERAIIDLERHGRAQAKTVVELPAVPRPRDARPATSESDEVL